MKAVLGLAWWLLSSKSCSPSTLRQRPYRKLCRMSEVMTSASASPGAFSPVLSTRASAGSTEPIMGGPGLAGAEDGGTDGPAEAGDVLEEPGGWGAQERAEWSMPGDWLLYNRMYNGIIQSSP